MTSSLRTGTGHESDRTSHVNVKTPHDIRCFVRIMEHCHPAFSAAAGGQVKQTDLYEGRTRQCRGRTPDRASGAGGLARGLARAATRRYAATRWPPARPGPGSLDSVVLLVLTRGKHRNP